MKHTLAEILDAIARHKGNHAAAARELGMTRSGVSIAVSRARAKALRPTRRALGERDNRGRKPAQISYDTWLRVQVMRRFNVSWRAIAAAVGVPASTLRKHCREAT